MSAVAGATSPSQLTAVVSDELPEPTRKPLSSKRLSLPSSASIPALTNTRVDGPPLASTPLPVSVNTSPGRIDDSSSPTSSLPIGLTPPVSFGGDTPANGADSGFSDVPDVVGPVIQTLTGGQSQTIPVATIGGFVDNPIPNGETIGPAPLTSTFSSGEIGIATITSPATAAIATTGVTSVPPSAVPGCVVPFVLSLYTSDDCMSSVSPIDLFATQSHHHLFDHHHHKFKKTSSFTVATKVVFYASTEISGTPTSILKTETIRTVLPTVLPVHVHKSPNRSASPPSGLTQLDDSMLLTVFLKGPFP